VGEARLRGLEIPAPASSRLLEEPQHDLEGGMRASRARRGEAERLGVHEAGDMDRRKYEQSCSACI